MRGVSGSDFWRTLRCLEPLLSLPFARRRAGCDTGDDINNTVSLETQRDTQNTEVCDASTSAEFCTYEMTPRCHLLVFLPYRASNTHGNERVPLVMLTRRCVQWCERCRRDTQGKGC